MKKQAFATAGAAELMPEIPALKKHDEERKKPGAAIGLSGEGGVGVNLARGAALAAIEEASVAQGGASAGAGLLARLAGSPLFAALGRVLGTALGKAFLLAALSALAAVFFRAARSASSVAQAGAPSLSAPTTSLRAPRAPRNLSLKYAADSSRGLGTLGSAGPMGAAAGSAAPSLPGGAGLSTGTSDNIKEDAAGIAAAIEEHPELAGRLGTLPGAKLSSGLGGGASAASFGQNDVFAKGPRIGEVERGKLGAFRRHAAGISRGGLARAASRGGKFMRFRSGRESATFAVLRNMGGLVGDIRNATKSGTAEASSAEATKQWENSIPTGIAPPSPVDVGGAGGPRAPGIPAPSLPNAPALLRPTLDISACTQDQINDGMVSDGTSCISPADPKPKNSTDYQDLIDAANDLLLAASALTIACSITRMIGQRLVDTNVPYLVAAGNAVKIVGMVIGIIGAVLAIIAAILGIVIAAKYHQTTQGTITALGGLVAAASAFAAAFSDNPKGTSGVMGLVGAAISFLMALVPKFVNSDEPKAPEAPKIPYTAELPKPPAGEHYETDGDPNDPNNHDWHLAADGNPPGPAPAGSTWVHDPAGTGWTLEPDRSGLGLPSLPPGQHYEGDKPAEDGPAPYAPPAGAHWEHSDAPNSDPNAWVLYNANGREIGRSAGVSPDGTIYGSQEPKP